MLFHLQLCSTMNDMKIKIQICPWSHHNKLTHYLILVVHCLIKPFLPKVTLPFRPDFRCIYFVNILLNCPPQQRSPLFNCKIGPVMVRIAEYLDLQLFVQSASITTKVVSLNPAHREVYLIQHYVIKFVSDLFKLSFVLLILVEWLTITV